MNSLKSTLDSFLLIIDCRKKHNPVHSCHQGQTNCSNKRWIMMEGVSGEPAQLPHLPWRHQLASVVPHLKMWLDNWIVTECHIVLWWYSIQCCYCFFADLCSLKHSQLLQLAVCGTTTHNLNNPCKHHLKKAGKRNIHELLLYHSGVNFYVTFPSISILQMEMDKVIMDNISISIHWPTLI